MHQPLKLEAEHLGPTDTLLKVLFYCHLYSLYVAIIQELQHLLMEVDKVCTNMIGYQGPRKSAMPLDNPDARTAKHDVVLAEHSERGTSTDKAVGVLVLIRIVERPLLVLLNRQQ